MTKSTTAAALLQPVFHDTAPSEADHLDEMLAPIDQLIGEGRFDLCYALLKQLRALVGRHDKLTRRLDRLYHAWVPRWHFGMLNDHVRNRAFADALASVDLTGKTVLDIGAGSGLLSMMAARQGAAHVYACEMVTPVAEKAVEIVARNGYANQVSVIPKISYDIRIGYDMPHRADVLVSETIDCGFVGEGFLGALRHAREQLVHPDALLIPRSFALKGALLESQDVLALNRAGDVEGFWVAGFNEFSTRGYFPVRLDTWSHRLLCDVETLIEFDLRSYDFEPVAHTIEFEARANGRVHGVVFWFDVELVPGVALSNAPGCHGHWMQAFTCFDRTHAVAAGDRVSVELDFGAAGASLTLATRA